MRFFGGFFRASSDNNGIVWGCAGAKRWLFQLSGLFLLGFVSVATLVSFFLQRRLVALVVALVACGLSGLALRVFAQPCAWLGLDWNPPVLFKVSTGHLEVTTWEKWLFRTHVISASKLQDLRVFRASAACASNPCFRELTALQEAAALEKELPRAGDAAHEIQVVLRQLFAARRPPTALACGLLAAKLHGEEEVPLLLSRRTWSRSGVDELCMLASAARRQLGIPEKVSLPELEDPAVRSDGQEVQHHLPGLSRVPSNPSSLSSLPPEQPAVSITPTSARGVQFPRVVRVSDSSFSRQS